TIASLASVASFFVTYGPCSWPPSLGTTQKRPLASFLICTLGVSASASGAASAVASVTTSVAIAVSVAGGVAAPVSGAALAFLVFSLLSALFACLVLVVFLDMLVLLDRNVNGMAAIVRRREPPAAT